MVCINDRSSSVWLSGYLKLILSADTRFTALLPRSTNTVSFFSPFCQLVWSFCEWVTFWRMKYYGRVSTKQANLLPLWHSSPVERGFSVRTNFVAVINKRVEHYRNVPKFRLGFVRGSALLANSVLSGKKFRRTSAASFWICWISKWWNITKTTLSRQPRSVHRKMHCGVSWENAFWI